MATEIIDNNNENLSLLKECDNNNGGLLSNTVSKYQAYISKYNDLYNLVVKGKDASGVSKTEKEKMFLSKYSDDFKKIDDMLDDKINSLLTNELNINDIPAYESFIQTKIAELSSLESRISNDLGKITVETSYVLNKAKKDISFEIGNYDMEKGKKEIKDDLDQFKKNLSKMDNGKNYFSDIKNDTQLKPLYEAFLEDAKAKGVDVNNEEILLKHIEDQTKLFLNGLADKLNEFKDSDTLTMTYEGETVKFDTKQEKLYVLEQIAKELASIGEKKSENPLLLIWKLITGAWDTAGGILSGLGGIASAGLVLLCAAGPLLGGIAGIRIVANNVNGWEYKKDDTLRKNKNLGKNLKTIGEKTGGVGKKILDTVGTAYEAKELVDSLSTGSSIVELQEYKTKIISTKEELIKNFNAKYSSGNLPERILSKAGNDESTLLKRQVRELDFLMENFNKGKVLKHSGSETLLPALEIKLDKIKAGTSLSMVDGAPLIGRQGVLGDITGKTDKVIDHKVTLAKKEKLAESYLSKEQIKKMNDDVKNISGLTDIQKAKIDALETKINMNEKTYKTNIAKIIGKPYSDVMKDVKAEQIGELTFMGSTYNVKNKLITEFEKISVSLEGKLYTLGTLEKAIEKLEGQPLPKNSAEIAARNTAIAAKETAIESCITDINRILTSSTLSQINRLTYEVTDRGIKELIITNTMKALK